MSTRKSEKQRRGSKDSGNAKNNDIEHATLKSESVPAVISENAEDIRTIEIKIESYKNILPFYPVSDIRSNIKYLDKEIGETRVIPVTDDEKLILGESVEFTVNVESIRQMDQLASYPVFITTIQSSGILDPSMYEQMKEAQNASKPAVEDIESLFSMYEAFTGEKAGIRIADVNKPKKKGKKDKPEKETEDKNAKGKSKSETSKGSKTSKKSKSSKSSTEMKSQSSVLPVIKSEIYGMCAVDLIPLFYGETAFTETLLLQPIKRSCQILSTFKNFPEVTVTVSIKENIQILDMKNVLNFTVESICNVPTMMSTDMDCKICVLLPLLNADGHPTLFFNPKITASSPGTEIRKRWPGIHDIGYNANTTKYLIESDFNTIKNKSNLDLQDGFREESTRLEFNYLKRNALFKSGNNDFAAHIITYRKIVLEIFLTPKTKKHEKVFEGYSEEPDEPRPKSSKSPPYLHLMAILDVIELLYPGINKIRIAAPITTFTNEEAAKAGLEDSYFFPKPRADIGASKSSKTKLDKSKKKIVEKKEKPSKKDHLLMLKEDKNLAGQLPPKPEDIPPPEPSVPVYNEEGKPCFIIVEIELLKPIKKIRDIEELKADLYELQMEAVTSAKTIINKHVASDFYVQTINELVKDLYEKHQNYSEERITIPLKDNIDFLGFLKKSGAYQTYLNSITTAATLVITNKYICEEKDIRNSKTYQNLISEVYTDLISDMHGVLNALICTGMKPVLHKHIPPSDQSLFYSKEAAEVQLYSLADRYLLERIVSSEDTNPDYWFDYAVYNMEINDSDKAFECLKEAIAKTCEHKYSLLLFAALLTKKGRIEEAETCFLNILVLVPKWLEGWCVLFLFYQKCGRNDGMEMALDMTKKLFDEVSYSDYFCDFEDLAWSNKNIPDTIFFRTAICLLKMRLYSWVELALAHEVTVPKYYGYVNYLLAAVNYYQKNYDHALEHIEEAKDILGCDFAIQGLSGHLRFAKKQLPEAKEEYFHVIESFDRPEDIHLIYVNCAEVLYKLGDDQKARKLLLTACKYRQTPHVWFTVGKLYFEENDVLSAEECLNEANKKDNKHAGVWAYLTLVNLKLNRIHEAEQCYQQAVRSNLDDEKLDVIIREEFKRVNSSY